MKYSWDFNEIRNNKDELIKKLSLSNNTEEIDDIETLIKVYTYISTFRKKSNSLDAFDDILLNTDINELIDNFLPFYTKDNLDIINSILPSIEIINNYEKELNIFNIKNSNDSLIEEVLLFFKATTTPKMYYKILKMLGKRNVLNIVYLKNGCYYPAVTICDDILKKKYINVTRENRITDIPNTAHEFFHYLYENCSFYKGLHEVNEVEEMFSNILFANYFSNRVEDNTGKYKDNLKELYLTGFKGEIQELVLRNGILQALDNNQINYEILNEFTKEYLKKEFDEEKLIPYLNTPQETNIAYSFSYLIALDLFYIYKEDKELAFYLIKKIKNIRSKKTLFKELSKNKITFFEDDYKNLKKCIKNMTN